MKILVVTQYFWPETFRINELVEMLVAQGHEVTILTGVPNYPTGNIFSEYKNNPNAFNQFKNASVKRVPMTCRGSGSIRLAMNYISFAMSASIVGPWLLRGREFDFIFTYEPSPITVGIPALVLCKFKRAKCCLWILDLWPETPVALGLLKNKFFLWATECVVRLIYRNTDLLLIQSPGFRPSVEKYAPGNARIEYFPSWADSIFDVVSTKSAPELQTNTDVFTILFAGNIGEAQDFKTVLKTAELLMHDEKNIQFVIVGDGRQTSWVEKEIEKRGLSDFVIMLGRFPMQRMPEFFNHADALLVSLKSDPVFASTIPAKVQAYMAAGIPIVALLDGEGANAINRWNCGIVADSGDPDALAGAIIKLSNATPAMRKEMGENGRCGAKTEFNRELLVQKLLKWMDELQ